MLVNLKWNNMYAVGTSDALLVKINWVWTEWLHTFTPTSEVEEESFTYIKVATRIWYSITEFQLNIMLQQPRIKLLCKQISGLTVKLFILSFVLKYWYIITYDTQKFRLWEIAVLEVFKYEVLIIIHIVIIVIIVFAEEQNICLGEKGVPL